MLSKRKVVKFFLGVLAIVLVAFSGVSYADWSIGIGVGDHHDGGWDHRDDHHFYRWHDHPHYGWHMRYLPDGYFTVWVGGTRYFYSEGIYYTYVGDGDYVMVQPPVGAYVNVIPQDFQPVSINGRIYYTDNGVYYELTEHHGYRVVEPPVVYAQPQIVVQPQPVVVQAQPAPVVVAAPVAAAPIEVFPVNVPNNAGGYTAVNIRRSGTGYVGPQGEFYASFPSVAQLKAMYANQK